MVLTIRLWPKVDHSIPIMSSDSLTNVREYRSGNQK